MNMNTSVNPSVRLQFRQSHWILRGYLIFAVVASVLQLCLIVVGDLNEKLVPLTGWEGLFRYSFTLFFALLAMSKPHRKSVGGITGLLAVFVALGCFDTYQHLWGYWAERDDFGNPYLMYHPARPVITVLLPGVWLVLLNSPSMRRWKNET